MKQTLALQPDVIGPTTSGNVAAGAKVTIGSKQLPLGLDCYMVYFGNSIDVQANAPYALFRIKVNGSSGVKPFDNITSQFGSIAAPTRFPSPYKLPSGALIELEGEMLAGAAGNTLMAATLGLMYVTPGHGVPVVLV